MQEFFNKPNVKVWNHEVPYLVLLVPEATREKK